MGSGDEDRLSRLPDKLIHKILSFVDTQQAVQTSVLSRRWQLLWTTLPFLTFLEANNVGKLIHLVFSKRNHDSHVSDLKFRAYNSGCCEKLFERCVDYAISHGVQSLDLELSPDCKSFKLSTFKSMSVNKLMLKVRLEACELQSDVWDLPALTTLHLKIVFFQFARFNINNPLSVSLYFAQSSLVSLELEGESTEMCDKLSALVNLKNLTLFLSPNQREVFISCPQLLNLSIKANYWSYTCICGSVVVLAPKLWNFTAFGIFTVIAGVPELENVNISLQGWFGAMELKSRRRFYRRLTVMLSGLGNAKNLTLDLESIEVLNKISEVLLSLPSPFDKLKHVKLPRGFKESSISGALRTYLLDGSPNATFVTKLPQNNGVEDSMVDANTVRQTTDHSVKGTDKDHASSSRGERNSGLWQGHEVNSEFVSLLILHKYRETLEHFTTKHKKLCTMNLNMLCNSVNDIFEISVANVDSEMIGEYREVFSYLRNLGFNVSWVVDRLNYIEHLRFSKPLISELRSIDCHIDNTETKLQESQSLRVEKKSEIEKAPCCWFCWR